MYWIYLVIAAIFEVCWTVCIKYVDFAAIGRMVKGFNLNEPNAGISWLAFIGYIVFGIGNIFFFSKAMQGIGMSLTFAVWTGLALIGTKLVDTFIFKEPWNYWQILYMAMILIGVVGLKNNVEK